MPQKTIDKKDLFSEKENIKTTLKAKKKFKNLEDFKTKVNESLANE